jgi:hypothetical protein
MKPKLLCHYNKGLPFDVILGQFGLAMNSNELHFNITLPLGLSPVRSIRSN